MGQKSAAYNGQGAIVGFYDDVDSPAPQGVTTIEITDAQWATCLTVPGWTVVDGALVAPSSAFLLAQAKALQLGVLSAAYGAAIQADVSYTTKAGVTKTFQADGGSVSNLQNAILGLQAAGATPSGFYWLSADNTQVPFTYADLQGLAAAMMAQGWTAFQHLQAQKAAVAAAASVSAVQAVSW